MGTSAVRRRARQTKTSSSKRYRLIEINGPHCGRIAGEADGWEESHASSSGDVLAYYFQAYRDTLEAIRKDKGPKGLKVAFQWAATNTGLIIRGTSEVVAVVTFQVVRGKLEATVRNMRGQARRLPVSA